MAGCPSAAPFQTGRMRLRLRKSCGREQGFTRSIAIRPIFRESSVSSCSYTRK